MPTHNRMPFSNSKITEYSSKYNWASEASPTLGCSFEISRDICIYVYMCVCRGSKSVGGITWAKRAHAQSQYWAVLGGKIRPVTPVIFISTIR